MSVRARKILFPRDLGANSLHTFADELETNIGSPRVELDFSEAKWMPPFYLLMAASEINRFKDRSAQTKLTCSSFERKTYAAHIGFFKSFGLDYGNAPGAASGSENYQPITVLWAEQVRQEAVLAGTEPGAIMEGHAERLAKVLARPLDLVAQEALTFSLREILRNSIEHGESDRVALCAQYWPTKNRVEVGVVDWGIGLRASLKKNPDLAVGCDQDAVLLALMPGVSGRGAIVRGLRRKTEWTNSGHGLYMISRLCRRKGSFLLGSNQAAILLSGSQVLKTRWRYPGTAARLEIETSNLGDYSELLKECRSDSALFRKAHPDIALLTPSVASMSLVKDFAHLHME